MDDSTLRPDCARCDALCCVALPFDRGAHFAFDKAGGEPCRHLCADNRCAIHDQLADRGMGGCVAFDCLGAGQRVTQEVFPGRSWREGPQTARAIFEAFRTMRRVQELLQLLSAARRLALSPDQSARCAELTTALDPEEGWTPAALDAFERGELEAEVRAFLAGLREVAGAHRAAS